MISHKTDQSDHFSSKKRNQLADGVTSGVTKIADKMAAPTPTRKEEQPNVAVCSTPSTLMASSATSQGPSTPRLWIPQLAIPRKESGKKWYRRRPGRSCLCPHARPLHRVRKNMTQLNKTPSPTPKKMRVKSPLQDPGREKLIAGQGREYRLHEKHDLDKVVSDQLSDKTEYVIIRAYRQTTGGEIQR